MVVLFIFIEAEAGAGAETWFYEEVVVQVLLYFWVRCFLSYLSSRTNRHSAWCWNLGFIRFHTTRKLELSFKRITSGNPIPDSSKSCMFLPAPYIGLLRVPTESRNLDGLELCAYSFGPCKLDSYIENSV